MKPKNISIYIVFAAFVLLFSLIYAGTFESLMARWLNEPDYSYGFIIPAVSVFLIWQQREALQELHFKPSLAALPLLIMGLLMAGFGITGAIPTVARISIPLVLLSSAAFCLGWRHFKRLAFPLGFLVFMIPLPAQIQGQILPLLQNVATWLGTTFLSVLGYTSYSSGNVVFIGGQPLNVAEACSGLRYIFPLVGVGAIYSYLFEEFWWKRIVNVLMAIPIAVLMNGIRIAATGIGIDLWGVSAAIGFSHDVEAYFVFIAAFYIHFLFGRLLRLLPPFTVVNKMVDKDTGEGGQFSMAHSLLLLIMLATMVGYSFSISAMPSHTLAKGMKSFPLNIPGWIGHSDPVPSNIIVDSGADDYFSAIYSSMLNQKISLYIGYNSSPFSREREGFFHSPSVCLPTSGWNTLEENDRKLKIKWQLSRHYLPVSEQISKKDGRILLTFYWFQTAYGADASALPHQLRLAGHALRKENTHDLFIRVITEVESKEKLVQARSRLVQFITQLESALMEFFKSNESEAI